MPRQRQNAQSRVQKLSSPEEEKLGGLARRLRKNPKQWSQQREVKRTRVRGWRSLVFSGTGSVKLIKHEELGDVSVNTNNAVGPKEDSKSYLLCSRFRRSLFLWSAQEQKLSEGRCERKGHNCQGSYFTTNFSNTPPVHGLLPCTSRILLLYYSIK